MRRNFILFVIVTVVIVVQDCALAEDQYGCCSDSNSNDTACCLSCLPQYSNCSSLNSDFKSFNTTERAKCLFRTTTLPGVSASTDTTPNTVTFEDTTVTESLTTVGVEEIFTICVLQCPLGFYEENQNCYKCDDLCKNCTLEDDSVKCLVCKHGMNSTGQCCPRGTQEKMSGNITICEEVFTPTPEESDFLPVIIGCAVGGVVVICILVVVVCCLRRRSKGYSQTNGHESGRETKRPISELLHLRRKKKESSGGQLPSIEDLDVVTNRHPRPYENTATIDHRKIAIGAQQEQDKKGRYIRDPTEKNKKTQKKTDHDKEPQEVYENQATINIHTQESEFHKKKKGPFNKLSKKFKSKKGNNDKHVKPEPQEPVGAPTEEYEEVNPPAIQSNMPTETYEDVGSNQPDFPQEVYEDTAQTGSNDDLPQEEYTAMDPSTQQPTEEYLPMKVQSTKSAKKTKPTKVRKTKTEEGTTNQGFNAGESIYANVNVGGDEGHYQNLQSLSKDPDMPEEDYQNYQGPLSK